MCVLISTAFGAGVVSGPVWASGSFEELTQEHRQFLMPLKPLWNSLPAQERATWESLANNFESADRKQKQRMTARIKEWASMTPEQRNEVRRNFKTLSTWDTDQKSDNRIDKSRHRETPDKADKRTAWKQYMLLSPAERARLGGTNRHYSLPDDNFEGDASGKEP
ncbi:MAG: DUF3106 domain-containing protein [Limnobacter sp.]|nr:DUF3106 domain-containing protein [Limnobacter sp.]